MYAQCLNHINPDDAQAKSMHQKAVEIYNSTKSDDPKTAETLTDQDIVALVPYDYL